MAFTKAKLLKVKDGFGLTLTFKKTDVAGAGCDGTENMRGLIHPDLKKAFDALTPHMAMIAGFVLPSAVAEIADVDLALFEKYHVHGYSLGGDDDSGGIVISGHLINYRGKAVNYHTPFELFDGAPEARYAYMDDLQARVRVLEDEIDKYMGGKRGEPHKPQEPKEPVDERQGDLFKAQDAKDQSTTINVLEPEDGGRKFAPNIQADADAQARVAEMSNGTGKAKKSAPPNPKKRPQTPNNKDGKAGA